MNQQYKRMKEQMTPTDAVMDELYEKIEAAQPARRANPWRKRAVALAMCMLVAVGGALGALRYFRPNVSDLPPVTDGGITGLPVKRELLSDMPGDALMQQSRILLASLEDFFLYDMQAFAVARVTKTQNLLPSLDIDFGERQQATLEILEWVFNQSDGAQQPEDITLIQNRLGGCTLEEQTNLLRPGGVYLLPLVYVEGEYYLMGDLDVLFEVDEDGNIYSHSDFEDFAAFDGRPWGELADAVRTIVRENPLVVEHPNLAQVISYNAPLVEITVLDGGVLVGSDDIQPDGSYSPLRVQQEVRGERLFLGGVWGWMEVPPVFALATLGEEAVLCQGERYLLFLSEYEGEHVLETNRAAKINADGSLTALDEAWSCFEGIDSLEQLERLVLLAGE